MNREATQPQRLCQLRKVRDADASQNLQKIVFRPRSTDLLLYVVHVSGETREIILNGYFSK